MALEPHAGAAGATSAAWNLLPLPGQAGASRAACSWTGPEPGSGL